MQFDGKYDVSTYFYSVHLYSATQQVFLSFVAKCGFGVKFLSLPRTKTKACSQRPTLACERVKNLFPTFIVFQLNRVM